ncbi:MAG TPA: phosphoribosylamine--glycine ligase [Nitrospirae bacterium]|nr:phosphoribosylamine--glycine ligase [Nitrospirota bacterium]
MKALVIGSGGREHAIVWKLSKSRHIDKIYCCPGNAGISEIAECIDIDPLDFDKLKDFVRYEWVEITIVGPEQPLALGIVDCFQRDGLKILGPNSMASRLESSKSFAKDFMKRHKIPTANYSVFNSFTLAEEYIRLKGAPIVIKADGLAGGKGVFVASTIDEAIFALKIIFKDNVFGEAGNQVVIEECLQGEEASFMVFTDGHTIIPMASSQDHKRVFDKDEGPNTGGMGAYSPAPVVTEQLKDLIMDRIISKTIAGLRSEGIIYKGILYAGLMIKDNNPYVLEFNCRLGDPETQAILSRLESDLFEIAIAINDERLKDLDVLWTDKPSVCIVVASEGYPGSYQNGKRIEGLDKVKQLKDTFVFHAGTACRDNEIVTNGGRVLGITSLGKDILDAQRKAYEAVQYIKFEGMHYRKDIAERAIKRL